MRFATPESAQPQTWTMTNESPAVVKQKEKSQTGSNPIFTRLQLLIEALEAELLQYTGPIPAGKTRYFRLWKTVSFNCK